MPKAIITESTLEDIADAIRDMRGTEDTYTPAEMAAEIRKIVKVNNASPQVVIIDCDAANITASTTMIRANGFTFTK